MSYITYYEGQKVVVNVKGKELNAEIIRIDRTKAYVKMFSGRITSVELENVIPYHMEIKRKVREIEKIVSTIQKKVTSDLVNKSWEASQKNNHKDAGSVVYAEFHKILGSTLNDLNKKPLKN